MTNLVRLGRTHKGTIVKLVLAGSLLAVASACAPYYHDHRHHRYSYYHDGRYYAPSYYAPPVTSTPRYTYADVYDRHPRRYRHSRYDRGEWCWTEDGWAWDDGWD
jgi:hypothetical protein